MRRLGLLIASFSFFFLQLGEMAGSPGIEPLHAWEWKEKTVLYKGTKITVKYIGEVEVLKVKPYLKTRRGRKGKSLRFDVVIKNIGTKSEYYHLSGEGKADDGSWLFGGLRRPVRVGAGKEKTVTIRTRYMGEVIPEEARVQVLQVLKKLKN